MREELIRIIESLPPEKLSLVYVFIINIIRK